NRYSDQETRFLVLRSLHKIKMNDSLIKVIAKVVMVAAIVLLKVSLVFWPIALGILVLATIGYFIVDRYTQGKLDEAALKSLIAYSEANAQKNGKTKEEAKNEAIDAAIRVVKKIKSQNLKVR